MNGKERKRSAAMMFAVFIMAAMAIAASTAHAQLAWPNGCGGVMNVINNTGCTVTLDVVTSAGSVPITSVAPPGVQIMGIPNGTVITGCKSAGGNTYALNGANCVTNFYMAGASCCVDVCFTPGTNCSVTISNSTAAPPCRP